jgi:2-methylisocitrate lyase-like PEP mutase family enzyme
MAAKIRAAVDARHDADLLVIARTDALAIDGIDRAIERAAAYVDAGADLTFVEAPTTAAELARIAAALPVPQVANMVVGGRTPLLPQAELARLGYGMVLYANAALQAAVKAMQEALGALKADGAIDRVAHRLADFAERQRVVDKDRWDALEERYRG